jgi:hypothetical protein
LSSLARSFEGCASIGRAGSPLLFRTVAVAGSPAMRSFFLLLSINLQTYHVCVEYGWRSIIAQATHTMPQRIVSSQQIRVVWKAPLPVQQDQISNPTSQGSFPKIDCAKIVQHRSVCCIDDHSKLQERIKSEKKMVRQTQGSVDVQAG